MNEFTKEELYRLYVVEELTMKEVASKLGIAVGSVYNYLHKYEIPTKPAHQGNKGRKHTEEARKKMSLANKGKKYSEETRKKIAEAKRKGGIGHKKKRGDGYIAIYFPDHPKSNKEGYLMEHDLIMECIIGRHLKDDEVVHHKNRIRHDNRKENLELLTIKEHASLHSKERWKVKKGGMTY